LELWMAQAQAEHQEMLNHQLQTPEMGLPHIVERILAREKAA
jgi:hypothetical protein